MDELIIQEFVENIELFDQKLVESVNDSAHHSDSMGLNRVKHLIYANCLDLLSLGCSLNENLGVQVIIIFGDKLAEIS
jgi:hypothetical protein